MQRSSIRRRANEKRLRNRRGVTLVLVAIMFTVLIGFVALALDFGRMYSFKAEIRRLTDAAALSAALDRNMGRTEGVAEANAFVLISANTVENSNMTAMGDTDIVAKNWDFSTSTLTSGTWGSNNAVQAKAHYTANWTFARVFGSNTKVLHDSSVAAIGSVVTSNCVKPWAIPYTALLAKLGYTSPYPLTHDLTATEVAQLDDASNEVAFLDKGNQEADLSAPGNFGWVDTNVADNSNGTPGIAASIAGCTSGGIGVGTTLDGNPGNRNANDIRQAMESICGGTSNCSASNPPVLVPIVDQVTGNGSNATYRVKYIGAFKLTRMDANNFYGYLTSTTVPATGSLSNTPGPVSSVVLVK